MAYWRDTTALWAADDPVHAGITKGAMQDNATVLGEQAKSHLDSEPLGANTITIAASGTGNWEASSTWIPQPVRALQTFSGLAWRDLYVYMRCELTAAGSATMRVFLLPREYPMAIDPATGVIAEFDYVEMAVPAAGAAAWRGGAITPSIIETKTLAGVDLDIMWVHLYIKGTQSVYVHNVRLLEESA